LEGLEYPTNLFIFSLTKRIYFVVLLKKKAAYFANKSLLMIILAFGNKPINMLQEKNIYYFQGTFC